MKYSDRSRNKTKNKNIARNKVATKMKNKEDLSFLLNGLIELLDESF